MAERDRHIGQVDTDRGAFVHEAMRSLVKELGDAQAPRTPPRFSRKGRGNPRLANNPRSLCCVFRLVMKPMRLSDSCLLSSWSSKGSRR